MSTFYEIDSTHISLKEFWWWYKSPRAVLICWLNQLLRARTQVSSDDPNTASTLPFVVEQLPSDVTVGFAALAAEITALGFLDPVFHIIHDPGTRTTIYWATYRHESGKYFARIHQRVWQLAKNPNRGTFPIFLTEFSDGYVCGFLRGQTGHGRSEDCEHEPHARGEVQRSVAKTSRAH